MNSEGNEIKPNIENADDTDSMLKRFLISFSSMALYFIICMLLCIISMQ